MKKTNMIIRIISVTVKLAIFYFIIINYHSIIQNDKISWLVEFDIKITTGVKPPLPLIEFGITSLLLSLAIMPDIFSRIPVPKKSLFDKVSIVLKILLASLPAFSIQFLHQIYDHNGRWRFFEDWVHPGSYINYRGVPWVQIFILSVLGTMLGALVRTSKLK